MSAAALNQSSGHIYNNYYSGDDSFLPNSCNQIISGEGSIWSGENCRSGGFGPEIIVQPGCASPYRDNGSYTAKTVQKTPKLNYTAKSRQYMEPQGQLRLHTVRCLQHQGHRHQGFLHQIRRCCIIFRRTEIHHRQQPADLCGNCFSVHSLTDSFDSPPSAIR